jgi:hypothetical protein
MSCGQRGAKSNAGSDMTQVTVTLCTLWRDGAWSKPAELKVPFRRATESELVCSGATVKMAWLEPLEDGVEVGQFSSMGQLAQARDVVLFDDTEHGGPKAGEAMSVFTSDAALLPFKQAPPVVMSIEADGTAKILSAK